jgi:hypothetical protein
MSPTMHAKSPIALLAAFLFAIFSLPLFLSAASRIAIYGVAAAHANRTHKTSL